MYFYIIYKWIFMFSFLVEGTALQPLYDARMGLQQPVPAALDSDMMRMALNTSNAQCLFIVIVFQFVE